MKKRFLLNTIPLVFSLAAVVMIGSGCPGNSDSTPKPKSSCLTGTLNNGVIAFYNFSNGSLNDVSGNARHLLGIGTYTPTADRSGNNNCAVQIINEDAAGNIPSAGTGPLPQLLNQSNYLRLGGLNTPVAAISVWYQPIGTYNTINGNGRSLGGYEGLVVGSNSSAAGISVADTCGEWSLGLYDCRRANAGVKLGTGSYWEINTASGGGCDTFLNAMDRQWKHVVITKSGNVLSMYINGVYQAPNNLNSYDVAGNFGASVNNLLIAYGFKGAIDDLILYNRALTTTEVNQLYSMGGCCL